MSEMQTITRSFISLFLNMRQDFNILIINTRPYERAPVKYACAVYEVDFNDNRASAV